MTGPLESEQQARELPEVRAVYEAYDADPGVGKMAPHNEAMLVRACWAAGVDLGAYDRRIIAWLAGFEPTTCAVVAGLITRAGGRPVDLAARRIYAETVLRDYQRAAETEDTTGLAMWGARLADALNGLLASLSGGR